MKRRSKGGGKAGKSAPHRAVTPKRRRTPPKAVPGRRLTTPPKETEIARLTRERDEALEQQTAPLQARAAGGGDDIFHVAIFGFAKKNINDAMVAFRTLASTARQQSGNLSYDIYRGIM